MPHSTRLVERRLNGSCGAPWAVPPPGWASGSGMRCRTTPCCRAESSSASPRDPGVPLGLLNDLPGPLRAPRLLAIDEDDGTVRLWLEDLKDVYARRWQLEQFGLAARHLGLFNGGYLVSRPVPTDPWLNDWLGRHRADLRGELKHTPAYRAELQQLVMHQRVQHLFGATVAFRAAQLLQDQGQFVEALSQLPQTLWLCGRGSAGFHRRGRPPLGRPCNPAPGACRRRSVGSNLARMASIAGGGGASVGPLMRVPARSGRRSSPPDRSPTVSSLKPSTNDPRFSRPGPWRP